MNWEVRLMPGLFCFKVMAFRRTMSCRKSVMAPWFFYAASSF